MEQVQMIYDIIFGQRYIMVPMDYTEIKPIKVIGDVKTLQSLRTAQRQNNGKNR